MAVVRVTSGEDIRGIRPGYELKSKWERGVEVGKKGNSFKHVGHEGNERQWSWLGPLFCS